MRLLYVTCFLVGLLAGALFMARLIGIADTSR